MGQLPAADPFNSFMLDFTSEQKFEIAKLYAEHYKQKTLQGLLSMNIPIPKFQYQSLKLPAGEAKPLFKIRLGYVSWDFADHPLSHLLQSIFKMHDRSRFHIVAFSLRPNDNSVYRKQIEKGCDEFYQMD